MIILADPDTTITVASDHLVPSVAEFTTAASDVIFLNDIANGVKMTGEKQEISGADTPDNLPETISEIEGITGNIVRFNLDVLNDLEKLNCYSRLRLWFVTNKGWCFGGQKGFLVNNHIPDWMHEGFGNRSKIPFEFKWYRVTSETTGAAQDMDYLDLTN
jgi:hypothetical protein